MLIDWPFKKQDTKLHPMASHWSYERRMQKIRSDTLHWLVQLS